MLCPNYRDSGDACLRSLAAHDTWDVGDAGQNGTTIFMPATDAGILDFAFRSHYDDEGVRRLSIITEEVSPQFLAKLVKVKDQGLEENGWAPPGSQYLEAEHGSRDCFPQDQLKTLARIESSCRMGWLDFMGGMSFLCRPKPQ